MMSRVTSKGQVATVVSCVPGENFVSKERGLQVGASVSAKVQDPAGTNVGTNIFGEPGES